MKLSKAHFPNYQQAKSFRRFGLPLLVVWVISGCVQSPVIESPTPMSVDAHISSNDKGEFQEVGNSTTAADSDKLKLRTTSVIKEREGFFYIPNESQPFTGLLQAFYASGNKQQETNFKDGKANGLDIIWYENGQKEAEGNYKDGNKNGLFAFWYESGQKKMEISLKDGKENSLATYWHENGQKQAEINYKDGKQNGLATTWYETGQKQGEVNYNDGKQNGLATTWYETGQKQAEINYKDGKQNGLATAWYETGQKQGEVNYKDGEVVALEKSSAGDVWRGYCRNISPMAENIMRARQAGMPMAKLMEAAKTDAVIESIIIDAYEIDRYTSIEVQQIVIGDFRDKVYLQCLKTRKP